MKLSFDPRHNARLQGSDLPLRPLPATLALTPFVFNAADLQLIVTPVGGTPVGSYPITATATATLAPNVSFRAMGHVQVSPYGVTVDIAPATTTMHPQGSHTWDVTVTNTGETADTFELMAGGIVSSTASFSAAPLLLAAGASTVVQLTAGPLEFALALTYPFAVQARSQGRLGRAQL
jgi:hypothetical protein